MEDNPRYPNQEGFFGAYGGKFVPPQLLPILDALNAAYEKARADKVFLEELQMLQRDYIGRPSPLYFAGNMSEKYGARLYFKREDLNHTGAHKINNTIGQALLARRMGKKVLIAETGAGQHGVATATAAALLGMGCIVFMGKVDADKQPMNVFRMRLLGAEVRIVEQGAMTLKEAVDEALAYYISHPEVFYLLGSVVGPHPYPMMVRDFQRIIGLEAREQILEREGRLPDYLVACVGGGSNAMGLFHAFLEDRDVKLLGVEPAGKGLSTGRHAATLTKGSPGVLHGFRSYLLQDRDGNPLPVYSIASGLDYPGVGPEQALLKDAGRAAFATATDEEALAAFHETSRVEGIIPALETAHALAYAYRLAQGEGRGKTIIVNFSGRGDKDVAFVAGLGA